MVLAVLEQSFEQLLNLDWGSDLNDEHLIFGWLFWTIGLFFKSSFPFSFVATSSVYRPVFSKLCNFHKKNKYFSSILGWSATNQFRYSFMKNHLHHIFTDRAVFYFSIFHLFFLFFIELLVMATVIEFELLNGERII